MTKDQTESYQLTHTDHLGQPLKADGVIGPKTEWSMDLETLCPARRNIVRKAQLYLGLVEDPPGSNSDPAGLIKAWLTRAGARPGDPWCAAFAGFCVMAGVAAGLKIPGAQNLGRYFPKTTSPVAGDLMWYPTTGPFGHCGIVTGVGPLDVMTIEGNCANAVRCVLRSRSAVRFSRTVEDTSGTPPGLVPGVPPAPGATR